MPAIALVNPGTDWDVTPSRQNRRPWNPWGFRGANLLPGNGRPKPEVWSAPHDDGASGFALDALPRVALTGIHCSAERVSLRTRGKESLQVAVGSGHARGILRENPGRLPTADFLGL